MAGGGFFPHANHVCTAVTYLQARICFINIEIDFPHAAYPSLSLLVALPPFFLHQQVSSFGMATPPATPPLSVASSHGSTTSTASSSNHLSNNVGSTSSHSRSSRRKRPRRKSLAGCNGGGGGDSGGSGGDNVADYIERRYRDVAPSFSSSLSSPSYFRADDGGNGDSGDDYSGDRKRTVPPRLLPPLFPPTKTKKSPPHGRGRGCRRRGCCCCRLSRCLLAFGLCAVVACLTFKTVWWFQWQARCMEGCYDPSMAKTGSRGPEQVRSRLAASGRNGRLPLSPPRDLFCGCHQAGSGRPVSWGLS